MLYISLYLSWLKNKHQPIAEVEHDKWLKIDMFQSSLVFPKANNLLKCYFL